jgi:hypothetical protein
MRPLLIAATCAALVAPAHAVKYRDLYWPKPETNEAAVQRWLNASSYDKDPKIAAAQIRRDAQLGAARIRAETAERKAQADTLRKALDVRAAPKGEPSPVQQRPRRRTLKP